MQYKFASPKSFLFVLIIFIECSETPNPEIIQQMYLKIGLRNSLDS